MHKNFLDSGTPFRNRSATITWHGLLGTDSKEEQLVAGGLPWKGKSIEPGELQFSAYSFIAT